MDNMIIGEPSFDLAYFTKWDSTSEGMNKWYVPNDLKISSSKEPIKTVDSVSIGNIDIRDAEKIRSYIKVFQDIFGPINGATKNNNFLLEIKLNLLGKVFGCREEINNLRKIKNSSNTDKRAILYTINYQLGKISVYNELIDVINRIFKENGKNEYGESV